MMDGKLTGISGSIGLGLALLTFIAAAFTAAAACALGTGARSSVNAPRRGPALPVTILKPLHLAEPGLEDNLRSFFAQDYDGPIQLVFGANSQADSALSVVNTLRKEFPGADVDAVADPKPFALNPKVANLISMVAYARHDLLILSDSDIRVNPDYVRRVAALLDDPEVGAVSLLYSGTPLGNIWSKLAAMNIDCHFLPNARLGLLLGLAHPCFGSTIAFRRQTLETIGGFEAISNVLADDYELGRAIRARGYRVLIPDFTVETVCSETSALAMFRQELRWGKTTFLLARIGYIGSIVTYPIPLALLALVLLGISPLSLSALGWALASRLFLVFKSGHCLDGRRDYLWLLPLRDVLSFVVFLASFFGKTVAWRGRRFATRANGALAPV